MTFVDTCPKELGEAPDFEPPRDEWEHPLTEDSLQTLRRLCGELVEATSVVNEMEENLSSAKSHLHHLRTVVVPEAMATAGVDRLQLSDGIKITVTDFVSGSLPKDQAKNQAAIDWLEAHNARGLLKTMVSLDFSRDERDRAEDLVNLLDKQGYCPKRVVTVHSSTLHAFAKEAIRTGAPLDAERLGLYVGRVATVGLPKGRLS